MSATTHAKCNYSQLPKNTHSTKYTQTQKLTLNVSELAVVKWCRKHENLTSDQQSPVRTTLKLRPSSWTEVWVFYYIYCAQLRYIIHHTTVLIPSLHDTTGCQTGCQTGLTTGWIFVYRIQPVDRVNGAWQSSILFTAQTLYTAREVPFLFCHSTAWQQHQLPVSKPKPFSGLIHSIRRSSESALLE